MENGRKAQGRPVACRSLNSMNSTNCANSTNSNGAKGQGDEETMGRLDGGMNRRPATRDARRATLNSLTILKKKQREARRELILSAARDLFAEKDFRSVTAREIAGRAGVSPGALYLYYKTLDELFLDVFFAGARDITERLGRELKVEKGCSLARFCGLYVDFLNTNMSFYQMMGHFMLGGNLSPEATARLDPVMRRLLDHVEQIVAGAGIRSERRLTAHALFSALNGVMISYARYPGRSSEETRRHTLRLAGIIARRFETP
jgi:AcrR family transcriptional regulator